MDGHDGIPGTITVSAFTNVQSQQRNEIVSSHTFPKLTQRHGTGLKVTYTIEKLL